LKPKSNLLGQMELEILKIFPINMTFA